MLIGHVDVVPASRNDGWLLDGRSVRSRDTRRSDVWTWRGRYEGVCRGHNIRDRGIAQTGIRHVPGGGGLTNCTVIEEECTGDGTLASLSAAILADDDDGMMGGRYIMGVECTTTRRTAVIIPEPFPWTWRALVHGVGDGQAMSRPVDVKRIECHRGGIRLVRLP